MLQNRMVSREKERVCQMRVASEAEELRSRLAPQCVDGRPPAGRPRRRFFSLAGFLRLSLPALFLIAPAALPGPPELQLPRDLVYDGADGSPGPVVFRHATHFELAENRCTACHPRPFQMLSPERLVTHCEMNAGRSCGLCHDGRKAAAVDDDCGHCHASGKNAK